MTDVPKFPYREWIKATEIEPGDRIRTPEGDAFHVVKQVRFAEPNDTVDTETATTPLVLDAGWGTVTLPSAEPVEREREADQTKPSEWIEHARDGRLNDLGLLVKLSEGGRELDITQVLSALDLEGPADDGEIVDAAEERLYEYALSVEKTTLFEIVIGTGGPDDRLIVECDTYESERESGAMPGQGYPIKRTSYEIRRILYRYSWEGSAERVLYGDQLATAEAYARRVVPELAE